MIVLKNQCSRPFTIFYYVSFQILIFLDGIYHFCLSCIIDSDFFVNHNIIWRYYNCLLHRCNNHVCIPSKGAWLLGEYWQSFLFEIDEDGACVSSMIRRLVSNTAGSNLYHSTFPLHSLCSPRENFLSFCPYTFYLWLQPVSIASSYIEYLSFNEKTGLFVLHACFLEGWTSSISSRLTSGSSK